MEIRKNANVVYADPDSASVLLDTGETVSGDLVVLADGYSSSLRSSVTGYCEDSSPESRVLFVAFTVDLSILKSDPSFNATLEPTHVFFFPFLLTVYSHSSLVVDVDSRGYHHAHLCSGKQGHTSCSPLVSTILFRKRKDF